MSWDEDACYETSLDIPSGKYGKLIAIPGGPGPSGPAGATGPAGPAGPAGPPGPAEGVEFTENKGEPDGYAPLGAAGIVPPEHLPPIPDGSSTAVHAAALKAHLWVDYRAGVYQRDGVDVDPATVLTHNSAAGLPYLNVNAATTNEFPAGTGGSTGVIGSGGAMYTNWTVSNPGGVPVEMVTISGDEKFYVEFSTTLDAYASGATKGVLDFVSPVIADANRDRHLSFILQAIASNLEQFWIEIGWEGDWNTANNIVTLKYAGGGGRVALELPASTLASDKLRFRFKNFSTANKLALKALVREVSFYTPAVPGGLHWDVQPVVASSLPAHDVSVLVPAGDYQVFAWTDQRGVVGAPVSVTGTDFSLLSTVGTGKVTKIAVWTKADYADGVLDVLEPPFFQPVVTKFDVSLMQKASDKVTDWPYYSGPEQDSFFISTNRFSRSKVEVAPGDHNPLSRLAQCRSEVIFLNPRTNDPYPYGTDLWTSFAFKTDTMFADYAQYGLIWQWLDSVPAGLLLSPSLYVMMWPDATLGFWTISNTETNPTTNPLGILRCSAKFAVGQWNRVVLRSQHSRSGGGKLGVWLNGQEVYAWQDTPIGYTVSTGLGPHYGYYGANTRNPVVIDRANVEFGTRDLSSRITNPLPI